jgi:hypothetical protein
MRHVRCSNVPPAAAGQPADRRWPSLANHLHCCRCSHLNPDTSYAKLDPICMPGRQPFPASQPDRHSARQPPCLSVRDAAPVGTGRGRGRGGYSGPGARATDPCISCGCGVRAAAVEKVAKLPRCLALVSCGCMRAGLAAAAPTNHTGSLQ